MNIYRQITSTFKKDFVVSCIQINNYFNSTHILLRQRHRNRRSGYLFISTVVLNNTCFRKYVYS